MLRADNDEPHLQPFLNTRCFLLLLFPLLLLVPITLGLIRSSRYAQSSHFSAFGAVTETDESSNIRVRIGELVDERVDFVKWVIRLMEGRVG